MEDLADLLRSRLQVGDAVLSGGRDAISWIIQTGSRSPYSHIALVATRRAWQERSASTAPYDAADLLLPGDYSRAEPFETVARFVRTGSGWTDAGGRFREPSDHPTAALPTVTVRSAVFAARPGVVRTASAGSP